MIKPQSSIEVTDVLFERIDYLLKNAHYWLTEQPSEHQSREAIMEARGSLLTLKEKVTKAIGEYREARG